MKSRNPQNPQKRIERGEMITFSTFREAAEIIYFIDKNYSGKGLGRIILDKIEEDAKFKGICNILASISSKNIYSIKFHEKNGFVKCGKFPEIGRKFGNTFGIIWMRKNLLHKETNKDRNASPKLASAGVCLWKVCRQFEAVVNIKGEYI